MRAKINRPTIIAFSRISKRIGKSHFAVLTGEITTDSCDETIKKLTLAPADYFVQIVPLRVVAGERHLESALEKTLSSFENKINFSKKPALEFLIRLLGEKQLEKVFKKTVFGKEPLVLVCDSRLAKRKNFLLDLGFVEKKFKIGENKKELAKFYGISKEELLAFKGNSNALEDLVIEKTCFVEFGS